MPIHRQRIHLLLITLVLITTRREGLTGRSNAMTGQATWNLSLLNRHRLLYRAMFSLLWLRIRKIFRVETFFYKKNSVGLFLLTIKKP